MTLLEEYIKAIEKKETLFLKSLITVGEVAIGPTSKGNTFFKYGKKEIANTLTPQQLREIRYAIDQYLTLVIGDEK